MRQAPAGGVPPRRAFGRCLLALAAPAGVAALTGTLFTPLAAQAQPATVRVMTFNIHHGEGIDGRLDLDRIAQVIIAAKADIVGLQEVDRGVERTGRRDILKELADLTGLRYAFGKNIDLQGGDYGNALLTRYPVLSEGNRLLEAVGGGEQRGVLQTVLDVEGRRVLVLVTHLDHRRDSAQRPRSAEEIREAVQAWGDGPVVLMGDFNDVPASRTYEILTGVARDSWVVAGKGEGYTIPVETPQRRIDWVLLRGLEPVEAQVIRTNGSDHLPVIVSATLPPR